MPRRIAVINEKGGSAKTTLSANLGSYAALRKGYRVLAVDMDPQAHLAKVVGGGLPPRRRRSRIELLLDAVLDREPLPESLHGVDTEERTDRGPTGPTAGSALDAPARVVSTRVPGLDVLPAAASLGRAAGWERSDDDASERLDRTLRELPRLADYDWVVVDGPPSFGPLTLEVLRAVDEVVIPVPLTYLGLDGCARMTRTLDELRRSGHEALRLSMVVPIFHRRTRLAEQILRRLEARYPKEIAQTVVGYHVRIDEAQTFGVSIFEYAPGTAAATAMAALAEELDLRDVGDAARAVRSGVAAGHPAADPAVVSL